MPGLADVLGVAIRTILRWRAGGSVTFHTADRCATSMGLHVLELWPDVYERLAGTA